jgi:hypothetical protein
MTSPARFRTYSGVMMDLRDPDPSKVRVADLAHHLAYIGRFGGAAHRFYSVASHSVYVSRRLAEEGHPPDVQLAGLLHDASEAYLGDVVSGLKRMMPEYRVLEARWEHMLERLFGVEWVGVPAIKNADVRARIAESRDLFSGTYPQAELDVGGVRHAELTAYAAPVVAETPDEAEFAWLSRAAELGVLLDADDPIAIAYAASAYLELDR